MKTTRKALSLLMALAMLVSLFAVTAFAEGDTGTITIENTTSGQSYSLYKVFDATFTGDSTGTAYTIQASNPWYTLVKAEDSPFLVSDTPVGTTPDTYTVTIAEGNGQAVLDWFNGLTDLPDATATEEGNGAALKFTGLGNGYYYVTSGLGALITLTNLNNTAEIVDKNQTPSWDNGDGDKGGKFVLGDDGTTWGRSNTAAIGETVHYKLEVNAAPNYTSDGMITEYQIVDTEGAAIYVDFHSMKVKVDGTEITDGWIQGYDNGTGSTGDPTQWHAVSDNIHTTKADTPNYSWYVENKTEDDNQFTIHIKWAGDKPLYADKSVSKIEITYDATLRSNATIGKDTTHNKNTATLKWATNNGKIISDGSSTVTTTTFGFAVQKNDGNTQTPLEGVEFQLKKSGTNEFISVYPSKNHTGRYYVTAAAGESDVDTTNGSTTTLTTNANGQFVIDGLKGGDYILVETQPLDGYNSIADTDIRLEVPTDESKWSDVGGVSTLLFTVNNYKGTVLPETGSTGTRLFILFGALAAVGAGIFLVSNKRMSKEGF